MKYSIRIYAQKGVPTKRPSLLSAIRSKINRRVLKPFDQETVQKKGRGFYYLGKEYVHYSELPENESAIYQLSKSQVAICVLFVIFYLACLWINWLETLVFSIAFLTLLYFSDLLFSFFLITRSFFRKNEISISPQELNSRTADYWPSYTVFCPLYREYKVVPQFVSAMSQLNYPKDKLQIMFLLEENDKETIENIKAFNLPEYFQIVIIPNTLPKTKPKALNYGLRNATGDFVVIYDAEDVPDKDQLKKVVLGFQKSDPSIGCIQAKLNFYNPDQNILTRIFTAEYSLWFDLVLTGLQSIQAPIPLGGTSNHFRTSDIKKLKGWDSFNVTEDCDLGMRLTKNGLKTVIIDSTTLEEANSEIKNWFWQRSRWIKGYIQTYVQHVRDLDKFSRSGPKSNPLVFQLVIGGKLLSTFINPFLWLTTTFYFVFYDQLSLFIEQFFPLTILYMAVICLIVGNFLYMTYYMVACFRYGHHSLIKYMYLVPLYWLAMSAAGWVALYQFIVNPHYWSKTKHGLHLKKAKAFKPSLKRRWSLAFISRFAEK